VNVLIATATTGAGLATAGAMLLDRPPARMRVRARAWCLIVPYLIATGCRRAWPGVYRSQLPYVLSAVRTDRGELVQLWCPSAIGAAQLHDARDILASACYARQVRVMRPRGHARLVTLEVIRHQYPSRTVVPAPRFSTPPPGAEPPEDLLSAASHDEASPYVLT
jgi:hypothetical protein